MNRVAETRSLDKVEVRIKEGVESRTAYGYGVVFDSSTLVGGEFTETVARSATVKTIQEANIRFTFNHDFNNLLATTKSGNGRLISDDKGVMYEIDLPNTTAGEDVRQLIANGDLHGASWMGYVMNHELTNLDGDIPHRNITEIALLEMGPVAIPQYEDSTAALRALGEAQGDFIKEARDALAKERNKFYLF